MMRLNSYAKHPLLFGLLTASVITPVVAQQPISNAIENSLINHGIEQYKAGLYLQATATLEEYLKLNFLPTQHDEALESNIDYRKAYYYYVVSNVKAGILGADEIAKKYIEQSSDLTYVQRTAFALAQYYFYANDYTAALPFYEKAGISNLTNEEISDAKFEMAYCYFFNNQLSESKNLFAAIKDIKTHKYYIPGNYYYGLLAYNDRDYKSALRSFEAIKDEEAYAEVIPYYLAEINYYLGNKAQLRQLADAYLAPKNSFYYKKEMQLLRAQLNFEEQKYAAALPDFESYIDQSDKVRKEVYYELGYTYYKLQKWSDAIETFKELSPSQDSLGQNAMYLLGDCYLRLNDKKGARNAFGLASELNFNPSIKEAANFLYAKLSYELGNEIIATRKFNEYIQQYPTGANINEARTLLSNLLLKGSNFEEAYRIMSASKIEDPTMRAVYQKVLVGRGIQLMMDKKNEEAYKMLHSSLDYPSNKEYVTIAHFWKAEIDYQNGAYKNAVDNAQYFLANSAGSEDVIKKISAKATKANANLILGFAQMELGSYDKAQLAFTTVTKSVSGTDAHTATLATLKAADAAFMSKDFAQADKLYEDALKQNVSDKDYVIYQRAIIAGLNDNNEQKVQLLNQLNNANSTYGEAAQMELASMQLQNKELKSAIGTLENLIRKTNSEHIKSNATFKLAYAYQEIGNKQQAIQTYQSFIEKYPTSSSRKDAIESLRLLYVSESNFDGYLAYAQKNNLPETDELIKQQSYFDELENEFEAQKWTAVIDKANLYLRDYPQSQYKTQAHYYRAESNRMLQNYSEASADYEKVIAGGWNAYSEDAYSKLAALSYGNNDFVKSKSYYQEVFNNTQNEAIRTEAQVGLMKSYSGLNELNSAEQIANDIIAGKDYDKVDVGFAHLVKAKAALQNKEYNEAIINLNKVSTQSLGALTAEAKYLSALVLKEQNKLSEAVKVAEKAVKTSAQYQYWVAKNFILIAEIMLLEKDYFEANAIVEELKIGVKEPSLVQEVNELYERVKTAQKANSKME